MPKVKARTAPMWSRGYKPTVDDRSEWDRELADILADPAYPQIDRAMRAAQDLGFDVREPDIFERAVAAGRRAYADRERERIRRLEWIDANPRQSVDSASKRHVAIVYYMRLGELVKIGTSTNITSRHNALNPQGILALELGGYQLEQERHAQFSEYLEHGEWFRLVPEIASHIVDCRDVFTVMTGQSVEQWLNGRVPSKRKP